MLVKANKTFRIKKDARINEAKGSLTKGSTIRTLTDPIQREGQTRIMVRYTGKGTKGEAANGTKFWLKLTDIEGLCEDA